MNEFSAQVFSVLLSEAVWVKAPLNDDGIAFVAKVAEKNLAIQVNDFPQEHLFTLLLDGQVVLKFDDWPDHFGGKPWLNSLRLCPPA